MLKPEFDKAPAWAEASVHRAVLSRLSPALLLIEVPYAPGEWNVATAAETDAVARQDFLGRLLRPHCALMALPYVSHN